MTLSEVTKQVTIGYSPMFEKWILWNCNMTFIDQVGFDNPEEAEAYALGRGYNLNPIIQS
jgi:hypothetical protein